MDKMFEKLDMGNVSDGYHTFNELYRYRMLYNAAFFNELAKGDVKVCKSHKHYDGEKSPSSSSISLYILWISLSRMTVLSLTYIFSTSSSQKKILSL